MEQAFRLSFRKHEKKFNGVNFYQYEIVKLTGSGMQSRMHDAEKIYCYLASSNGMKFFTKLCKDAIDKINRKTRESVSAKQLSQINLLLALKEGVEKETENFR